MYLGPVRCFKVVFQGVAVLTLLGFSHCGSVCKGVARFG